MIKQKKIAKIRYCHQCGNKAQKYRNNQGLESSHHRDKVLAWHGDNSRSSPPTAKDTLNPTCSDP